MKLGDICEIRTPSGFGYIQYTHDGAGMGQLVRILPGLFAERPGDFELLSKMKEMYFIFYTLDEAIRKGQTEIVAHQPIPEWAQPYPLMRWAGLTDSNGRAVAWKIFKASDRLTAEMHQRTPAIPTLTAEQKALSIHMLVPHSMMVKEMARGWTPERAEEFSRQDRMEAARRREEHPHGDESGDNMMYHFLYFSTMADANGAASHLRDLGFSVEVRRGADGKSWLVLASMTSEQVAAEMKQFRDDMEAVADRFSGEYDGWQAKLDSP